MHGFQRISRNSLVFCGMVALLVTLITGWYPKHGGGPGSSGVSYGVPFSWRVMKWPPAIDQSELFRRGDGRVEERVRPFSGAGTTRKINRPFWFGLDVAIWYAIFAAIIYLVHARRAPGSHRRMCGKRP